MNKEKDISLAPTIEEQPAPTAPLTPARALAIRWVFQLEIGVDSAGLHPTAYHNLLQMLSEENKNPFEWTDEECDEFLSSILDVRPVAKPMWAPLAEYLAAECDLQKLPPLVLCRLCEYYFPPYFFSSKTSENEQQQAKFY